MAQCRNGDALLFFHNELVLLGGTLCLESLPRESALEEVYEHVPDRFEIISTRLLDSQVIVDGGVSWRTRERASLSLRNVLQRARVAVSFGETKVDTVDEVSISSSSVRDKVRRLNVTVNQVPRVHELHALQHLVGHHQDRFERKATPALVELVFEGRPEQIHNHEIVRVLRAEVMHFGKAGSILKLAIYFVLVAKLGTASAVLLELYGNLRGSEKD